MPESSIDGVDELIATLQTLEKVPQVAVTSAAKKGATMALNFAKANLQPVNSTFLGRRGKNEQNSHQPGTLMSAMRIVPEKSRPGRKVYQVTTTWYARFKDLGFTARNGQYVEGSHFLKYALTEHYDEIKGAIIKEMSAAVGRVVGT